jgi:bleomycin hydrolase
MIYRIIFDRTRLLKGITIILLCSLLTCCTRQEPQHFTHEVLNRMTPIKDQGDSPTCWIYAMLAAIETEHLRWGDSVNLSPYYIEKMIEQEPQCPASRRGMGATLIRLIHKYGIVGYNAMSSVDTPAPRFVFMLGAEYTPQEFARSVCARDEYVALTSTSQEPYYKETVLNVPDNWLHDRFLNLPMDSLLATTLRAVRQHHGVCWESRGHAMAIVGIAHNDRNEPYFIMKNSWGTDGPYKGLDYLSFDDFKTQTLAVELPRFVVYASN